MENANNKNSKKWFLAGLGLVLVSALVFVLLGGRSVFTNHDQLDGEMLTYILSARHMFDGASGYAEFMNGMAKTSLTPPSILFVPLFKLLGPLYAFIVMRYVSMAYAYVGMYLLLRKLKVSTPVSVITAVVFAYAPFIHVYGFSMYGVPMLMWAFMMLEERAVGALEGKSSLKYFAIIILTALGSSLVLSGFAMIICAGIHWIILLVKKEKKRALFTFFGAVALTLTFILCNLSLFKQILGIGATGYASHKDEYTLTGKGILDTFADMLLTGAEHSGFERIPILILVAVTVLYFGTFKRENADVRIRFIRQIFFALIFISLGTAIYESNALVSVRESLGGAFKWFQVSRLDWLAPSMILVMLALTFEHIISRLNSAKEDESRIWTRGLMLIGVVVYVFTFATFLLNDTWKDNVKVILGKDPSLLTWDEYYAPDVYSEVEAFIKDTNHEEKNGYKCVSLGISPAAALYNGFECLDGYSNNYDVEYKHEFRNIIAPELDKNDYIRAYFDEWGNRCYLYSAQIPGYFTVEKGGFYFSDYKIDADALKAMGGKYIFSAAYIDNAESQGLTLLNKEPISTDRSYYQIYIYEVNRLGNG